MGISESTLRKWCLEIEKSDYHFERGANNTRYFNERDVLLLQRVKQQVQELGRTVSEGVNIVISMFQEEQRAQGVRGEQSGDEQELSLFVGRSEFKQILERLDMQEEFNKALLERLEQQQSYIDNSIKRRDEQLMNAMRQSLETQKQLAIAETLEKEKAKPWWKKLFGK